MMGTCWRALCQSQIALIEAGTGVGKSLAYLIPAALFAKKTGQRIVIATHTIHLQEQLLSKDLHLASEILGWPINAVLAKGMGNYICQKRVEGLDESGLEIQPETTGQIERFHAFRQNHSPSSRSDLPFSLAHGLWSKLNAESDSCLYQNCDHFNRCGLMKARNQSFNSQIVIANHHLLFADLAQRAKHANGESSILPPYRALIVDEAHHAQEIAAHHLAATISKDEAYSALARLISGIDAARPWSVGKLDSLLKVLAQNSGQSPSIERAHGYFKAIWSPLRGRLIKEMEDLFCTFELFERTLPKDAAKGERKVRLATGEKELVLWDEKIASPLKRWRSTLQELIDSARDALGQIDELFEDRLLKNSRMRFLKAEIGALINRIDSIVKSLDLLLDYRQSERIFWLEMRSGKAVKIACSELNIGNTFEKGLFAKLSSAIFCSATLTAHHSFDFLKKQLGLSDAGEKSRSIVEQIYPSPFDYINQTLLAVPTDLPSPSHETFLKASCRAIEAIVARVQGNAFILFTSREAMERSFELLKDPLQNSQLLMQGDAPRYRLLREFEAGKRTILFGLSSFWEGVDVKAGILRCVILAKLPFRMPDDPLLQARAEALRQEGVDPFREDALPRAIITFKQGFGRLIRRHEDFGCIVCLDQRLIKSSYGKSFLKALPECPRIIGNIHSIANGVDLFFRKKRGDMVL